MNVYVECKMKVDIKCEWTNVLICWIWACQILYSTHLDFRLDFRTWLTFQLIRKYVATINVCYLIFSVGDRWRAIELLLSFSCRVLEWHWGIHKIGHVHVNVRAIIINVQRMLKVRRKGDSSKLILLWVYVQSKM